ncbi:MAG: T9SS type A sorting domain-containing protein [Ignavibacteriales bacterium]|nr:T9SS type A sorting domain-containing protein [Ignavibacteriales bacterium]
MAAVVNSLADDIHSYPYDNPDTPLDESTDGICSDEFGRCTIRAAVEEANNINQPIHLTFSVSGTINLMSDIAPYDGSSINGNNQITLTGLAALTLMNGNTIQGLKISGAMAGITVQGNNNNVGVIGGNYNEIVNCANAIMIGGTGNKIYNNFIGITAHDNLRPNQVGILISEGNNEIGKDAIGASNIICGNSNSGIIIGFGTGNVVEGNYIGTNILGQSGLGNTIGIAISSDKNLIGGSGTFSSNTISGNQIGIAITAAPPDTYADQNLIVNNIIGLSALQDSVIPNNHGISITNGVTNTKIYDNVIAGNTSTGIGIFAYDDISYTSGHLIHRNRIGVNKNDVQYPNGTGIILYGNVADVIVGTDEVNNYIPNTIVGNEETGLEVKSYFGYSPNEIVFRKNIIYQNGLVNLFVDSLSNLGLKPPSGLSFNSNTLSGIHALPGMIIDVYKANRFEIAASAYEWLGSTSTDTSGHFAFTINDPSVEAVSVTATNPLAGMTSGFAKLSLITGVIDSKNRPSENSLKQNYPNPFNPTTTISFVIRNNSLVTLKVFNMLGQEVASFFNNEELSAGSYETEFTADKLASGIYFYRLTVEEKNADGTKAGSFTEIHKMSLLK